MKKTRIALALSAFLALSACQQTSSNAEVTAEPQQPQVSVNDLTSIAQTIPEPSQMKVDIVVSGRVSTLNSVEVVNVGKQIPYTYSDEKISNSPGFDWYVSKHFALKSDRPKEQVQLYMELLEMSYPHYIELFGAEPANIENQRIAAVYGSSKSATKIFVTDDGLQRGISAGGEAMYYNLAGYSYPSAREQHQRYIVIHEQGHAFQMALMDYPGWLPTWFTEGTADALAHHYYDPVKKQLKVMVFDRGSPMDYIRLGLQQYEQLKQPSILDMTDNPKLYRGINFLIVHFMLDDPRRSHLFKAYRDEMARLRKAEDNGGKETSRKVMSEIFGDWAQVEKDFAEYVANVDKTFNIAAGPWEQDGNRYWVRTLNNSFEHGSPRMDIYLKPGDKPQFNRFKFDQPLADKPTLLSGIGRGTEAPSIGIEIDYQKDHLHRGHVGLALAVEVPQSQMSLLEADKKVGAFDQKSYNPDNDKVLNVKIDRGETLLVEGKSIGAKDISFALPFEFIQALQAQSNPRLGVQVQIESTQLKLVLRTGVERFEASYPINGETRTKLLERHVALLAENAEHRITPYLDDGRDGDPVAADLSINAPQNPWRNPADKAISRLTRAIWRLGDKAPALLKLVNDKMIAATTLGLAKQQQSLGLFNQQLPELVKAIEQSGQSKDKINQSLVELSGLNLRFEWRKAKANGERQVAAVLNNQSMQDAKAVIKLLVAGQDKVAAKLISPGSKAQLALTTSKSGRASGEPIDATAMVHWHGAEIELTAHTGSRPYPWSSMAIVQDAKAQGDEVGIVSELRGPHAGKTKGKMVVKAYPSHLFEQPVIEQEVEIKPYEIKQFANKFKLKQGQTEKPYAIDVSFEVDIDGEPVLLKKRSKVQL